MHFQKSPACFDFVCQEAKQAVPNRKRMHTLKYVLNTVAQDIHIVVIQHINQVEQFMIGCMLNLKVQTNKP